MRIGRQTVRNGSFDRVEFVLIDDQTFEPIAVQATSTARVLDRGGSEILASRLISSVEDTGRAVYVPSAAWSLEIEDGYSVEWTLIDGSANQYRRKTFFECVIRAFDSQVLDSDINAEDPIAQTRFSSGVSTFAGWRRSAWRDINLYISRAIGQDPGTVFHPDELRGCHIAYTLRDFYRSNGSFDAGDEERAAFYERKGTALLQQVLQSVSIDTDETDTINQETEPMNRATRWRI